MGDEVSEDQHVPMRSDSPDMDDLFEEDNDFGSQLGASATSTDIHQQVLGVEEHRKLIPAYENHDEDNHESVEDNLEPDTPVPDPTDADVEPEEDGNRYNTQSSSHANTDFEPEQQAQQSSHEPFDHNGTMEDLPDEQSRSSLATPIDAQPHTNPGTARPVNHDTDSSSLFVPERGLSPHSPVPNLSPPRLNLPTTRQTATPARRPDTAPKPSIFSQIRNKQRLAQARKNASHRFAVAPQLSADLDPETYLEAVTSGINPPPGAYHTKVDEEEMAHRHALANFQKQKLHYQAIREQHNGHLPFQQDVEWMKISGAEDARLKKRRRDLVMAQDLGDEQDLFPQIHRRHDECNNESDGELYGESSSHKRRRSGDQPRKQSMPESMQDAEYRSMFVMIDADDDRPKRKKKKEAAGTEEDQEPQSSAAKGKKPKVKTARPSRAKGAGKPSARKSRRSAKDKRDLERAAKQASSLFNSDVFHSRSSLKGYQVLGSAFMRRRENDASEPKGGLMADQMGLGKTLMMLANIVNSRDAMHRNKDSGPKSTLLVASPALLTQWAAEIQQHTDCNMKVMRYGAGNRLDSTCALGILQTHDIILTTYGEIMKSYPKNNPPIECQTAEEKIDWWKKTYKEHRGVLHKMHFKRIVLDEAQAIKNHQSRTSIACRALMAHHKWALSGTPILNGLDELYPYFKFLEVPHTGSFKIFKNNYCGGGDGENAERLLVRLSQFMIRRTHADRMFNAPILKLPQANQMTHWCEFNSVERSIYNIVHHRFATNINMMSKKGTLSRSYSNVLVMLLRLRQLTAHVLMLEFVMRDLLEREDIEKIKEVIRKQDGSSDMDKGRVIIAIRRQLEAHELQEKRKAAAKASRRLAAEATARATRQEYVEPDDETDDDREDGVPVEVPQDGEPDDEDPDAYRGAERNKSGKGFGKSYDFTPFVKSLATGVNWEKKKEQAKCGECGKLPEKTWLTACGHLICDLCYESAMSSAAERGELHANCTTCGSIFAACTPCDEETNDASGPSRETRNRSLQRRRRENERLERVADDWLSFGGDEVLSSAKTLAIKAQILNWIREDPNVKVIIYTQFLAMIRILAKVCQQEGWGTEQYHGKSSLAARDKAIKEFAGNPHSQVLLASLRCGGLGLNLTMASKVIIIDPWWNQASEQQAFCRVFRIGQQDETFMTRMCVKNTVDERLIEMQTEKQREIDEVMEDRGRKTQHLEISDLMRLFGNIEQTEDGKPFIVVDNPAAAGGFHADSDHEGYADEF
ncbi:SNF2 family N-terminal domain-containing protein [Boeremia exigua]|uniref:SNF2 family N-terminal domain-containing protein n=1 Tax=Boeremia exigua TaxID=749465 RepID=UPI001E8E980B|nr:SNF2 family N-terminal domain-containing protein [Boeremia exigua]KAH6613977.1 SNF2 family N-terminal domain-containing protein [Boeremia exigua]